MSSATLALRKHRKGAAGPEPTWDELKREHEEERETSYNPDDERGAHPARFGGWR